MNRPGNRPRRTVIGDWRLEAASGILRRGAETVRLEPRVMAVLEVLADRPGEVHSKDSIIAAVWGDTHVGEAALSRCISELRRALGDDARDPRFIETLPKRGYRLVATVRAAAPGTESLPGTVAGRPQRPVWQMGLAVGLVLVLFAAWWSGRRLPVTDTIRTIAVLPLRALSDDAQQRFFAEGLTEQLIANLATLDTARVISGRAARLARDADASAADIARALGVDAVVDGTVQRSAARTLVSLELIQGTGERLIWGGSYQEGGDDWIEIQHEVAHQASREIGLALRRLHGRERPQQANAEARREVGRGHMLAARGNPVDAVRGIQRLRHALEIDPDYALAWALLAEAYSTQAWHNWAKPANAYAQAREAAHRAADLDPELPEAEAVLAAVAAERNQDWPEAERLFRAALEHRPPSAFALERYGRFQRRLGRVSAALDSSTRALALEPDSIPIAVSHAWNLVLAGELEDARAQFESVIAFDDGFARAYAGLCAIANLEGEYELARPLCARVASMPGQDLELGARAYAEARAGDVAAARATLGQLLRMEPTAAALAIATAHVGLNDQEAAIAVLEEAEKHRALQLPALLESPYLRPLASTPRLQRLLDALLIPGTGDV